MLRLAQQMEQGLLCILTGGRSVDLVIFGGFSPQGSETRHPQKKIAKTPLESPKLLFAFEKEFISSGRIALSADFTLYQLSVLTSFFVCNTTSVLFYL